MSLEAQDGPTIRTTYGVLILLFIVISVQASVYVAAAILEKWVFQNSSHVDEDYGDFTFTL